MAEPAERKPADPTTGATALERLALRYGTAPAATASTGTPAKPAAGEPGGSPAPRPVIRPAPAPRVAVTPGSTTGVRPLHVPGDTVAERVAYRLAMRRGEVPGASAVPPATPRPAASASNAAPAGSPTTSRAGTSAAGGVPARPASTGSTAPVRPASTASTAPVRPASTASTAPVRPASTASTAPVRPAFAATRPPLSTPRLPEGREAASADRKPLVPLVPLVPPSPAEIEATVDHEAYERYSAGVKALLGFDLLSYKRPQVWRRSNSFAKQKGCASIDELIERCKTDLELRTAMRDMITINVSEFFRNPEAWESLKNVVMPDLFKLGRPIRMWSAGCSLGYEPYTFAMMVKEQGSSYDARITATDLDETILAQARAGLYAEHQMVGVSNARRARFFEERGGLWYVKQELRSMVQWRRQDLLKDPFPSDLDLIACRNVVIYFTDDAKDQLYRRFTGALRVGGTLFIGATEAISGPRDFGLQMVASGLYHRVA